MAAMRDNKVRRIIDCTLIVWISLNLCSLSTFVESEETRASVKLDYLPEEFTDDKISAPQVGGDLTGDVDRSQQCYPYIGCFERIPSLAPRLTDPMDMGTNFHINNRRTKTAVPYEEVWHCTTGSESCESYPFNLKLLRDSKFDPRLSTIIVVPGYLNGAPCEWQAAIGLNWLKLRDVNVIIVEWVKGNHGIYPTAVGNTRIVARQIVVLMYYLAKLNNVDSILNEEFARKIYVVGHSLGAQIAGFVGQDFGGKIGHITGLDTAGPIFDSIDDRFRLDRGDAQVVYSMHTNGGKISALHQHYGTSKQNGHVDLYANDGCFQPGCGYDILGCSHKLARDFYVELLEHQVHLLQIIPLVDLTDNRMLAYYGEDFSSFHNGDGPAKNCPITTLDNGDLQSPDLNQCSVPIDFFSDPKILRAELAENYGVDFSSSGDTQGRKYFFYSGKDAPHLNHHNIIKIRISKEDNIKNSADFGKNCDVQITFTMSSGKSDDHKVEKYNLKDEGDHFEVMVPYLSPEPDSNLELASMSSNDFFLNENERLLEGVFRVFPNTISIRGLGVIKAKSLLGKIGARIGDAFRRLFGYGSKQESDNEQQAQAKCQMNIEAVSVQPFMRLRRHMSAAYTVRGKSKERPDIKVLKEGEQSPKVSLFEGKFGQESPAGVDATTPPMTADDLDGTATLSPGEVDFQDSGESNSEIYLDTVIFGPQEKEPTAVVVEEEEKKVEPESKTDAKTEAETEVVTDNDDESDRRIETSHVPAKVWIALTTMLIVSIAVGAVFIYRRFPFISRSQRDDRLELISEDSLRTIA